MPLTEGERHQLAGMADRLEAMRGFFASRHLPSADAKPAEWHALLVELKRLQGNFNNPVSFVGVLLAKEFLVQRHRFQDFDASRKAQGASGLDIDETTIEGERVVGEVKTTCLFNTV